MCRNSEVRWSAVRWAVGVFRRRCISRAGAPRGCDAWDPLIDIKSDRELLFDIAMTLVNAKRPGTQTGETTCTTTLFSSSRFIRHCNLNLVRRIRVRPPISGVRGWYTEPTTGVYWCYYTNFILKNYDDSTKLEEYSIFYNIYPNFVLDESMSQTCNLYCYKWQQATAVHTMVRPYYHSNHTRV